MNDLSQTGHLSVLASEPAISARGMVKTFGALRAVDGIDLTVPRAEMAGSTARADRCPVCERSFMAVDPAAWKGVDCRLGCGKRSHI